MTIIGRLFRYLSSPPASTPRPSLTASTPRPSLTASTPRFALDIAQRPFAEPLVDIKAFYEEFRSSATPPTRDQFETDSEYARRLPQPLDPRKLLYIRLPDRTPNYHYDISAQLLTVYGGYFMSDAEEGRKTIFTLDYEFQPIRQYHAQNRFGATFSVEEKRTINYRMKLDGGLAHFTPLWKEEPGYTLKRFAISVPMARELAREQATELKLILGLRLFSWERATFYDNTDTHDVTMEHPNTEHESYYTIESQFVSLHLVNCRSNTQFAAYSDVSNFSLASPEYVSQCEEARIEARIKEDKKAEEDRRNNKKWTWIISAFFILCLVIGGILGGTVGEGIGMGIYAGWLVFWAIVIVAIICAVISAFS